MVLAPKPNDVAGAVVGVAGVGAGAALLDWPNPKLGAAPGADGEAPKPGEGLFDPNEKLKPPAPPALLAGAAAVGALPNGLALIALDEPKAGGGFAEAPPDPKPKDPFWAG